MARQPTRICAKDGCETIIPPEARRNQRYCSNAHASQQWAKNQRLKARAVELRAEKYAPRLKLISQALPPQLAADGRGRARRGPAYEWLKDNPDILKAYRAGIVTETQIAAISEEYDRTAISRGLAQIAIEDRIEEERADWAVPGEATSSLRSFREFRERYFRTEKGTPFVTEPFHQEWIDAIVETMETGGRLMILSPPRHGKTQLLIHFCIWQIVKNPNIRIAWVAGNATLSQDWLASIMDELVNNEQLIADFCGPGRGFRPPGRSSKSWSRNQFTVATRTVTGIKAPSMVGVGRGSKVLSRDTDLIIADDIEDHETTLQPASRESTRNWWVTQVGSRVEGHTALVTIGSRQHPDDLYSHLLDNDVWTCMVYSAHDETCPYEEKDIPAHTDCMLWPSRHNYRWLMEQLDAARTTGGRALWEMVYLNRAVAEGLQVFVREQVEAARNPRRVIGDIPPGSYLIAGLDPSATGYQAAFLWAYEPGARRLHMVDLENEKGGGIPKAREQIDEWLRRYNVQHWVIEDNMYWGALHKDEALLGYVRDNRIRLDSHHTDGNKWDKDMGVTSIASWFESEMIDLPYGDTASQWKTDQYIAQLMSFSDRQNSTAKRRRQWHSDIVMASWFPFTFIRELDWKTPAMVTADYAPTFGGFSIQPMFNYDRSSDRRYARA